MYNRQLTHFLVLGLEMADFSLATIGTGASAGTSPISARPATQQDYERYFKLAFPNQNPNSPIFVRKLGMIFQSWLQVKRINPMLKDDEIAGLRWMLLGIQPVLPASIESLLYAVAGIGPRPPVVRERGFTLNQEEVNFIKYRLRLDFATVPLGNQGPDAAARRDLAKRKAERLANLVFKYKVEQMEWEDSIPMEGKDMRTQQEIANGDPPKVEYYYPDTESRRQDATRLVEHKRKRLAEETASLQVANNSPVDNSVPGQEVAFSIDIPAEVLGNVDAQVIQVMKPNPVDPASMIKASLVGALIQRVSIAHQDLVEAEQKLKRVKLDDEEKVQRWKRFKKLGTEVEKAFVDASTFKYGQVPSIEAEKYRENVHNYDAPFKVSPEERIQYDKEKGASAYVGRYGGFGVFQ